MQEINTAWAVLRNPAARADYDAQLRARAAPAPRTRAAATAVPVEFARGPAEGRATVSSGWRRYGAVGAVVLVVVAILVFTAYANKRDDVTGDGVEVETTSLFEPGTCVVLASVEGRITPVPVDCSSTGARRITQTVDLGRPCPPGDEAFDLSADEVRLCLAG